MSEKVCSTKEADTGWINFTPLISCTVKKCAYRKIGKIVEVIASIHSANVSSGTLYTLPAGYRPPIMLVSYGGNGHNGRATPYSRLAIEATGEVKFVYDGTGSGNGVDAHIVYMVD